MDPPGGVVEWLMALVLKTSVPKGTVGSNPTPSVLKQDVNRATSRDAGDKSNGHPIPGKSNQRKPIVSNRALPTTHAQITAPQQGS